jgi:ribosomal-protein-alanine N-acetyltransferase
MRPVSVTRLVTVQDAAPLADLLTVNREFLAPWEPVRPAASLTTHGQRQAIKDALLQYQRDASVPHVILHEGAVVGRVTLTNIMRGPFQSCNVGYWVASAHSGRGLATAAVREIVDVAFTRLGLHRVEAGTLPHNIASQRVLEQNGFVRFGTAPAYLRIAGAWQDHILFQLLNDSAL